MSENESSPLFKDVFNEALVQATAKHLARAQREVATSHPGLGAFKKKAFETQALAGLKDLELKARSTQISEAAGLALPQDFALALKVILAALNKNVDGKDDSEEDVSKKGSDAHGLRGWAIMPLTQFIAREHSLKDFDISLDALRECTKRFTAEFDVRVFLDHDPKRALEHVKRWSIDDNLHVRRLASEGTRSRLPWGMQLKKFVKDPSLTLPILEALKDDPELYVRRSVANHLNDVSKDHPELVAKIAKGWMKNASKERKWMVKHALRGLVKSGHSGALEALGYGKPKVELTDFALKKAKVKLGGALEFSFVLRSKSTKVQPLIVDYVVHHQKQNGALSPKVFKMRTLELAPKGQKEFAKKHAMKKITTRVYHPGEHAVEIQVNGVSLGRLPFVFSL